MAEKPKTNVDKFFEIYDADPALQARVQQAMDSYPGSLEIRDVMTEHVLLPVAEAIGVDPIHFGIIMCVNLAIGFVTPPVGVNLFVASGVAKAKLEKIAGMALPMIGLMLLVLLLCTYFPQVPLCLVGGK